MRYRIEVGGARLGGEAKNSPGVVVRSLTAPTRDDRPTVLAECSMLMPHRRAALLQHHSRAGAAELVRRHGQTAGRP